MEQSMYFPTSVSLPHQLLGQVNRLKQQLVTKIQNGQIQISKQEQFNNKEQSQNNKSKKDTRLKNQQYRKRVKELDLIRQQLASKLKKIEDQQNQLRQISKSIQKKSAKAKLQKSLMTLEDKQKLKEIKRKQQQFQQKIKRKINQVIQKINESQKQKQLQKSFKQDLKRKERVLKLAQKRQKLEESRGKTLQLLKNSQANIKADNYVYIRYQSIDKSLQCQRKKYQKLILNQKKQKMKTNFSQIRQHSIEHQKIMNQRKQIHLFELKQQQIRRRTKTNNYQSEFTRKIKQQNRIINIEKMRKINAKREARDKISNFNDYLTQNFKPKVTQQSQFVPKKQITPLEGLTHQQVILKGRQYLDIAKKKAKKISPQSKNQHSLDQIRDTQTLPTSTSLKYPDYLKDFRSRNLKQPKNMLQKILKQKKLNSKRVEQAIKWVKSKQQGHRIGINKGLVKNQFDSAFDKIRLLNSIYQNQITPFDD